MGFIFLSYIENNDSFNHLKYRYIFNSIIFGHLNHKDDIIQTFYFTPHVYFLKGTMPLKYATFLDYAAEARILEKDGGHWRFRHQNLQDYFANLDE